MLFKPVPTRESTNLELEREELCDYFFDLGELSEEEEDLNQSLFCSY